MAAVLSSVTSSTRCRVVNRPAISTAGKVERLLLARCGGDNGIDLRVRPPMLKEHRIMAPILASGVDIRKEKGWSGVAAAPSPSLATDEVEIPQVYENAYRLPENEHGVHAVDRIGEQRQAPAEGEEPEGHGKHALLASLGGDPLDDEPHGEEGLRQQPDR